MTLKALLATQNIDLDTIKNVRSISDLTNASSDDISFAFSSKFINALQNTKAGVLILTPDLTSYAPKNAVVITSANPYLLVAKLSKHFAKPLIQKGEPKISKTAVIMPNVFVGANSVVGDNSTLMHGVYVGNNVTIGNNCTLYPNVCIYDDTILQDNVVIHAGSVVGADGFGYVQDADFNHHKIYHLGKVLIESNVEIGANCTIDRAVFATTTIKKGTKLDNLIQIGHNATLGEKTIIAAQTGVAGSCVIEDCVMIGAQSGLAGHLSVGKKSVLAARSGVSKSIKGGKTYAGFPLFEYKQWLKIQAKISKLIK